MPNVQVVPPSTEAQTATLFVALELSAAKWVVAIHSPVADKIGLHTLSGGDSDGLLRLIERKRGEAEKALGRPVRVVSCHEAGYDGFWLHRLLCAHGIDNHVLDAASILVNRRARRSKQGTVGTLRRADRRGAVMLRSGRDHRDATHGVLRGRDDEVPER